MECWSVTRSTETQWHYSEDCEPADGWPIEEWPGVGRVVGFYLSYRR
jgi:hypothetical protein